MLMVILGAGASHDSDTGAPAGRQAIGTGARARHEATENYRPPLTKNLFAERPPPHVN